MVLVQTRVAMEISALLLAALAEQALAVPGHLHCLATPNCDSDTHSILRLPMEEARACSLADSIGQLSGQSVTDDSSHATRSR